MGPFLSLEDTSTRLKNQSTKGLGSLIFLVRVLGVMNRRTTRIVGINCDHGWFRVEKGIYILSYQADRPILAWHCWLVGWLVINE
jgi:hypothetical protein